MSELPVFGEGEGPKELADRCRRLIRGRHEDLGRAMGGRPLGVVAPPRCSKDLCERIERHNAAAATWDSAWAVMGDDAAALALAGPGVRGAVVAERACRLRARRYDLAQRLVGLIDGRGGLLEAVREALAPLVAAAETDLLEADDDEALVALRAADAQALETLGWQAEDREAARRELFAAWESLIVGL